MVKVTVGGHYQLPNGRIARTFGADSRARIVRYYFDDGLGGREVSYSEFAAWKERPDLKDFPNAPDPLLPYVFDLLWDLKYLSDLKRALREGHADQAQLLEKARASGIPL